MNKKTDVIDAHMHLVQYVAGIGAEGELRWKGDGMAQYADGRIFRLLPEQFADGKVTPEDALAAMDRCGVSQAVLLQGHDMGFQNLYSLDAQEKYPERFRAAVSYDPWSRDKIRIRDYLIEQRGAGIVKFELSTGSGLMCNHPTFAIDGEAMREEFDYCDEHGAVCVLDIGKCGAESWQPEAVRRVCLAHPEMKFVICHLLAPSKATANTALEKLRHLTLPNVWFDLAALPHSMAPDRYPYPAAAALVRRAADIVGADRILFGSDFPSTLNTDSYEHLIDFIRESEEFSEKEREAILCGNAETVYFNS